MLKPKIIVILGPTSSGKSELAIKIAKKINGEIISADSRQVYKGLDIGSGKVPLSPCLSKNVYNRCDCIDCIRNKNQQFFCYKNIPHYLLNIVSPKKTFTVTQYQELAKKALAGIIKRNKIPIICGGTGLYIDSLIYDYQFPNVPPQPKLRKQLEKKPTEELFKQLQKLDLKRAKNIDKHNRRRLIRALEIILTTKNPVPILNTIARDNTIINDSKISSCDILKIGINPPKEKLQTKIAKRIKQMFKNGLLDEIQNLRKQNISWNKISSFGFEYKYPAMFSQNKISKNEMIQIMIKENWRYAKRQITWFKRDKNIIWINNQNNILKIVKNFLKIN